VWKFDKMNVVINPEGINTVTTGIGGIEPPGNKLTEEVKVTDIDELIPGDMVYFVNYYDYEKTHEGPEAAWAGEHAIYRGEGKYQGFGSGILKFEDMVELLKSCYNNQGLKRGASKRNVPERADDSITGMRPGLLNRVKRLKQPGS
jgi:hypothetical protein